MAAFNHVMLSDAVVNNRFSAEFFDPQYVFKPNNSVSWAPIGQILRKCEYGISIAMNTEGKGFPIYRMNELDNCFALRPEKYAAIPRTLFEQYRLNENDVLFNRTNSFEFVGRTGIVKDQTDCTFASYLIRLVPDSDVVLPEYLAIYLNTRFGIGQIKRRAMRSINQANVSGSEVRKILIPIVDSASQKQIAKLVNTSYQLNKESEAAYTRAQQLLESELGLDKLRFEKPVGYTARLSGMQSSCRCDADFFMPKYQQIDAAVAKHPIKLIKNISEKLETGIYSPAYSEEGQIYIRGTDIKSGFIEAKNIRRTLAVKAMPSSIVNVDDILVTRVGSIGVCGIVEEEFSGGFFSDNLIRIRLNAKSKSEVSPHYLNLLLNTTYGQMQMIRYSRGSVQQRLNQSELAEIPVPVIPWVSQQTIESVLMQYRAAKLKSGLLLDQAKSRVEQLIEEAVQA